MKIKEVIVVEGKDDARAIGDAVEALTIETSGYGINEDLWNQLERAEKEQGLIIFTDPDYMGEQIRKRLKERFPNAKHAYIDRNEGMKKDNIGVENASPQSILRALEKAKVEEKREKEEFSMEDLKAARLSGQEDAGRRRHEIGKLLGIGYSNGKGLLKKLNGYSISREEWNEALRKTDHTKAGRGL